MVWRLPMERWGRLRMDQVVLHRTAVGRWLVRGYFASMSASSRDQSGILQEQKTKVLVPGQSLMWYGTQASKLIYDTDIYENVKIGQVEVIREDVEHLNENTVVLRNGQKFQTDVLICATGYKYGTKMALISSVKSATLLSVSSP